MTFAVAFPLNIAGQLPPERPVAGTNFTLTYSLEGGTLTLAVTTPPPPGAGTIDMYLLLLRNPDGRRVVYQVPPGDLPAVVPFTPEAVGDFWIFGVDEWALGYRLRARTQHGLGPLSAEATLNVGQASGFLIAAEDWTVAEERTAATAGDLPGRRNVSLANISLPATKTARVYTGATPYLGNEAVIHSLAQTRVITPDSEWLSGEETTVPAGTRIYSVVLWLDDSGAWSRASEDIKEYVTQGLLVAGAPTFSVLPTVTSGGTLGKVGSSHGVSFTGSGETSTTYQWLRSGEPISGATSSTYTPVTADDRTNLSVEVTLTNASGSTTATSDAVAITRVAPTASGSLGDVVVDQEAGAVLTVAAAGEFTGDDLTFSIAGHAAVSIDATIGVISISRNTAVSITEITVTATNSGGSASLTFDVTVNAAAPTITWPDDPSDAHWTVSEVTDPAEATSAGFPDVSGRLKAVWNAAIDDDPTGFTLRHDLRSGEPDVPILALPQVIPGATYYTQTSVAVGAQAFPKIYWRHTATDTFKKAGQKAAITIQGLDEAPPATGFPALPTAAVNQALGVALFSYDTAYNGIDGSSAFKQVALPALAYASWQGNQNTDSRLLEHLRRGIQGSTCPPGKGGFSMQFEIAYSLAALFAKNTSRVWNALTSTERTKIDLIVKGIGIAGCYTGAANAPTISGNQSKNLMGQEMFPWSAPNFSSAPHVALAILRGWLGSDSALTSFLNGFSKSSFHTQVNGQGLTNMATVMQSRSSPSPTNTQVNNTINALQMVNVSQGDASRAPTAHLTMLNDRCNKTWPSTVSPGLTPASTYTVDGTRWAYIMAGASNLPNLGATGMCKEFDGSDVGGKRCEARYAMWASRVTTMHFMALMVSGLLDRNNATVQACKNRAHIGWTDLKYKSDNGFRGWHHGAPGTVWQTGTGTYGSTNWIWTTSFALWFDVMKPWLDG